MQRSFSHLEYAAKKKVTRRDRFLGDQCCDALACSADGGGTVLPARRGTRPAIEAVFDVIRRVAADIRADATLGPLILDDLDLAGVDAWADSAVTIHFRIKVQPLQQWTVKRAFLLRLKNEFDRLGIELPFPHFTLYPGQSKDGSAPPLYLAMQK